MDGAGSDPGIEALRDGGVVASWENHGKTMGLSLLIMGISFDWW